MKHTLFLKTSFFRILVFACALLIAALPVLNAARANDNASSVIIGIIDDACGDYSLQDWVDSVLASEAGGAADHYIFALNRIGADYDPVPYARALLAVLEEDSISNPSSRMRAMLALISCGGRDLITTDAVDATVGQMGVMSYIYGLHLLNAGTASDLWNADAIVDQLLSLQKSDGGWAVNGTYSDADVTAMCLQALACYEGSVDTFAAISSALDFLSSTQKESGGFASYGVENCESACQVLIALTSLGVDPYSDSRFIKNGVTIPDNILSYRLSDGSFSHLPGDEENATASVQALMAFASLESAEPLYDLCDIPARRIEPSAIEALHAAIGWKIWAYAGILLLAALGFVIILVKKHGRVKRFLSLVLVCALLAATVSIIDIRPASDYYTPQTVADPVGSVTLSIRCDTGAGRGRNGTTPDSGVILPACQIPFAENETVLDILLRAAKEYKLQLEHSGSKAGMAYVNSIANLYEFDFGSQSGWMYSVNGAFPSVGCESCPVADGDVILWQYTLSNGEDLK